MSKKKTGFRMLKRRAPLRNRDETVLLRQVQALSVDAWRLFRNNVGVAWMGKWFKNWDGTITVQGARRVTFGLCVGSSDFIGWKEVAITQDMVGRKIAQFVAVECKSGRGKPTNEQLAFLDRVHQAGGISVVARSEDEARKALGIPFRNYEAPLIQESDE